MLWAAIAVSCVLAALWLIPVLSTKARVADSGADEVPLNKALYGEKLAEQQRLLEKGEITQVQFDSLNVEYQRQLLADTPDTGGISEAQLSGRWLIIVAVIMVPAMALVFYWQVGASQELALQTQIEERTALLSKANVSPLLVQPVTDKIIKNLQSLATSDPERPLYPVLLARMYLDQGQLSVAVRYYQQAVELVPEDGAIHAEYAQALFFTEKNQVTVRVKALAEVALLLEPNNDTALGLLGIDAFHHQHYQQAIDYWQKAMGVLPPMSPSSQALMAGVEQARKKLGAGGFSEKAASRASLTVLVELADGLDIAPQTTVFVYARNWQGSAMPLAIKKLTRADLPATVILDESMAMNPSMGLASVDKVELVARVSFTGTAMAASGDYEGKKGPIVTAQTSSPVKVVISHKIP